MKDELSLYRKAFRKLAKHFEKICPGYSFKFSEDTYASFYPVVNLLIKTPRSKKWKYIDNYPITANLTDRLSSYREMFKFLCRNMPIEIDDYPETKDENVDELVFTNRQARVRKYIRIPCFENIIDMIIKLGLKGIDIS